MTDIKSTPPTVQPVTGPIALWFLNDTLDKATMCRQLDEMAAKGFAALVIHPRDGIATPYVSQRWFEQSAFVIQECVRRGIKPWFYDDNPCPSGSAGGMVADLYPELTCQVLSEEKQTIHPTSGLIRAVFKNARHLLRIYAAPAHDNSSCAGPWQDLTHCAGMVGDRWCVQGARTRGYGPSYVLDTCDSHWRAWMDRIRWVFEWKAPEDRPYHILAVWREPRSDTRPVHYADLIHPDTTRRFIELTYQRAYDLLGPELFGHIEAGFSDEPKLYGPLTWSSVLPDDYQKAYGRDFFADLPLIIDDPTTEGQSARLRYRRLLGRLWKQRFWEPMARWCHTHGILLTGHSSPEEDPILQAFYTPALMQGLATMDWPGCDQITSRFDQLQDELCPLIASSVGHQHAKEHVLVETLGVSGEGITLSRMRRIVDHLSILGCDQYNIHGQLYSLAGHRKREAPPSIFIQQPYWSFFKHFSDHLLDWTCWHAKGVPVRPIAMVYPTAAFESAQPSDPQARQWAITLETTIGRLLKAGLSFDLVSDLDIPDANMCRCESGQLHVGKASYQSLILPEIDLLEQPAVDAISTWFTDGLEVLSQCPVRIAGTGQRAVLGKFIQDIDVLVGQLVRQHRGWLAVNAGDIVYTHTRQAADGICHRALWNPGKKPIRLTFTQTGESFELAPDDLRFTVNDRAPASLVPSASTQRVALVGPWRMNPEQLNILRLSRWHMRTPDGRKQEVSVPAKTEEMDWMPAQYITSGHFPPTPQGCVLECGVEIAGAVEELFLNWDVEAIGSPARLWINDHEVDLQDHQAGLWFNSHSRKVQRYFYTGQNRIRLQIEPLPSDERALIDPIYLCGRFHVPDPQRLRIIAGEGVDMEMPLDWTKAGFPQYSGKMTYRTVFELPRNARRIWLELPDTQHDPVEVRLNGKLMGNLCWGPWCMELTSTLQGGHNHLELMVANTLINQQEGLAQPSGLIGAPILRVEAVPTPKR